MSNVNIVHLRASNFYGGPERQLHMHARLAKSSEFEVTVSSFTEDGDMPEFIKVIADDGIPTHTFAVRNAYDPKAIRTLKNYLMKNDIQILCTHDYRTQVIGLMSTLGTKTKWIAFSRGWTSENLKIKLYHALDKIVIRFADHIVAVSDEQKRKLTRLLIPGRKITVAHNAIDPESFGDIEKVDLRAKFNLPGDSIICLAGGRFSPEKGQTSLVETAARVLKKNKLIHFIMFGDGPDMAKVKQMIGNFGIDENVICPGFEKNLLGCLKDADILVNPSLSEGLPNIVLEAMAFKVPVVATAVGGVPELITNDVDGFLVPPGDTNSFAEKILALTENGQIRDKFRDHGYQTIINSFSFLGQANKIYNVYRGLMDG
ncbi:MAG: glycosyltransferase family 4 protein [candidate division Zixibacteria bacterium]|nr:glycosyltransferase family 4 protein [candidate division Zixibacteria bacterium]